jgi:hypothetical protein
VVQSAPPSAVQERVASTFTARDFQVACRNRFPELHRVLSSFAALVRVVVLVVPLIFKLFGLTYELPSAL